MAAVLELVVAQVHTSTECGACYLGGQMRSELEVACGELVELAARAPGVRLGMRWLLGAETPQIWVVGSRHEGTSVLIWYATRRASAELVDEVVRLWAPEPAERVVPWRRGREMLSESEAQQLREALESEPGAASVALALAPEQAGWEDPAGWAGALASGREAVTIVE